jgi:hypothetical protein
MHNAESTEGYRVYRELHGPRSGVSHRRTAVNMNEYIQKSMGG